MSVADSTASNSSSTTATPSAPAAKAAAGGGSGSGGGGKGGLEGVVAARSEICFIDGNAGRLVYRGYEIDDLVENATFEEVGVPAVGRQAAQPPGAERRSKQQLAAAMALPPHVMTILKALPREDASRWTRCGRPSARWRRPTRT